jgi:hypothetical protein
MPHDNYSCKLFLSSSTLFASMSSLHRLLHSVNGGVQHPGIVITTALIAAMAALQASAVFAETSSLAGSHHDRRDDQSQQLHQLQHQLQHQHQDRPQPPHSRLIKPGTILPERVAPSVALRPDAVVLPVAEADDPPEPQATASKASPQPGAIIPSPSLRPRLEAVPSAIAR